MNANNQNSTNWREAQSITKPLETDNLVIGAGPTGLHAARTLINLGEIVTVVDINNQSSLIPEGGITSPVKRHPDINRVLDFGRYYNLRWEKGSSGNLQPSVAIGGLSNIWGASITTTHFSKLQLEGIFGEYVHQSYEADIKFISEEVRETSNFLAVAKERCTSTGLCNTICPNKAIWNAANELVSIQNDINLIEGVVSKVKPKADKWEVYFYGEQSPRYLAKRIYLCAGALASAMIAMSSEILPGSGFFSDTQAIFIPVLHAKNKISSKYGVALAQRSFILRDHGSDSAYFQYYPNVATVMSEAIDMSPKGTKFLIRILWRIINPYLGFGILFLAPQISNEIGLVKRGEKYLLGVRLNTKLKINIRSNLQKLSSLRKVGLLALTKFAKIRNSGDSFHYGSFSPTDTTSFEFTDLKEVNGFPSLHFMDSFSLKTVPTGPVTPSILAECEIVIRNIFGKL